MTAAVRDARPPATMVHILNPLLRTVLRTPLGRLASPLALLEFTGRRSNTTYRVVVAWHHIGHIPVVVTPAPWRTNFVNGTPVTVHQQGRRLCLRGVLDTNPDNVADAINTMLATGTSARGLALHIPTGHPVNRDDIQATHRAIIRFHPADHSATEPTQQDAQQIGPDGPPPAYRSKS
jgi:hypothetical protein